MRGYRLLVAALVTVVGSMAAAGAADGATLGIQEGCCSMGLVYTGAPGETNNVSVTGKVVGGAPSVTFSDPGNTITPNTSYDPTSTSMTTSDCTFSGDSATCQTNANVWELDLGDGNDSTTFHPPGGGYPPWPVSVEIAVQGGPGLDTLRGGWSEGSSVYLEGGPGADQLWAGFSDEMSGGPGGDTMGTLGDPTQPEATVSYAYAPASKGVMVTLDGVPNDGVPGEHDNVLPTVASVIGSDGDDVLTGNALTGHELHGQLGNDRLASAGGDATLDGGPGNDIFLAADVGHQYVSCGDGLDTVLHDPDAEYQVNPEPNDVITPDCENVF
jgi:hypothetical protein